MAFRKDDRWNVRCTIRISKLQNNEYLLDIEREIDNN